MRRRFFSDNLRGLVALAVLLLALPFGLLTVSTSSRVAEENHEETRGHKELVKVEPVSASAAPKQRIRLLPRRHLLLARPRPHVRLQLEAPARHDSYKRPLRC